MKEEESGLGSIKISETVIAQIAQTAALEIEGVEKLASDLKADISKLFGKKEVPGIKTEIENEEVMLDIFVIVNYGVSLPEIASKIQENVKVAVEKMTNLSVRDVNVNIQGIERGK